MPRYAATRPSTSPCPKSWSTAGDCDFAARPRLSAAEQPVFWSEEANTSVLRLVTSLPIPPGDRITLHAFLDGEVKAAPDALHILLRSPDPGLVVLLDVRGNPDEPLAALIPLGRDGLDRLAALDRLLRHLHGYKVPPDRRLTAQQRRRLKAMLRAVDGQQHHASQREIAEAIFGRERVAEDSWHISPLRDVVRDLLKDGTAMIAGGYRKLLHFRRR